MLANGQMLIAGGQSTTGTAIALSTANLYTAVQPGGSLYGLQASNPVDVIVAYGGQVGSYGAGTKDPMVGQLIGGVNVFGGGLALLRAIVVSADARATACRK